MKKKSGVKTKQEYRDIIIDRDAELKLLKRRLKLALKKVKYLEDRLYDKRRSSMVYEYLPTDGMIAQQKRKKKDDKTGIL